MNLWTDIGQNEKAARAALQMGDRFAGARKFQESLFYFRLVLGIKHISPTLISTAYDSIGRIYSNLQQRDLALLPRLAGVGAGQGTHPVVHAYIEFALVIMCTLHSAYL